MTVKAERLIVTLRMPLEEWEFYHNDNERREDLSYRLAGNMTRALTPKLQIKIDRDFESNDYVVSTGIIVNYSPSVSDYAAVMNVGDTLGKVKINVPVTTTFGKDPISNMTYIGDRPPDGGFYVSNASMIESMDKMKAIHDFLERLTTGGKWLKPEHTKVLHEGVKELLEMMQKTLDNSVTL